MKKALRVFCMILIIASFFTVTAFASYSINPVEPGQITIDGEVTEAEWGEAQEYYYISKGYESDTDEFVTWEYMPGYQSEATFEAYFKYDADYLYYAMTCHGIVPGNKLTTDQLKEHWNTDYWKQCCSWIGIAMYDDVVNNPQTKLFPSGEETRQVWTKLYFSLLDDGTQYACEDIVKGIWCTEYDGSNYTVLTEDDYAITYNGADLTYEARIPWSMITDRDDVGAGDNIVTAVVCKMDLQDGCESGNTLQWGAGVCTDNMTTGGVLGRLVGDKTEAAEPAKTEAAEEPAEEAAAEEPAEEPAEETAEEPAEEPAEEAAEKEAPAKTSSKRTILYVVLGVLVAAIIVIVILLFSGDKKKENKKEEEKEEKKD